MKKNTKHITLKDSDKKTISKNSDICTETHGQGCQILKDNEKNKSLN